MEPPIDPSDAAAARGTQGFYELPLFPLPLVLFPGMKVSLHIFEERYKEMVEHSLDTDRPFGIVLVTPDQPHGKDSENVNTYRIGCSARITQVERLDEGRFNIEIEGIERFRILEQHEIAAYRTGIVEHVLDTPMSEAKTDAAEELQDEVQKYLREFLTRQLAQVGQRIVEFDLPDDLQVLSFITACVLPVENTEKQTLLEQTDTAERLTIERDILRRAVQRLRRADAAGQGNSEDEDEPWAEGDTEEGDTTTFEPIRAERYRDYLCVN